MLTTLMARLSVQAMIVGLYEDSAEVMVSLEVGCQDMIQVILEGECNAAVLLFRPYE